MKKTAFYFLLTAIALMFVACEKGDDSDPVVTNPGEEIEKPEDPEVYDFWYFTPGTTESDTSKWETEDNNVYDSIPAGLNSKLMLNYTFDNSIDNEANSGITSKLDTTTPGNYFIKVDKTPKLCFEKNFTLSAWVKFTSGTNEQTIFSKIDSAGNYGYKLSYYNDSILTFYIRGKMQDPLIDEFAFISYNVSKNEKNEWQLVTAVWENDIIKLYINDSREFPSGGVTYDHTYTIKIPVEAPANDYNLYIGNSATGNTPFKGSLDQVMVFNKALTSTEVSSLYNDQN